MLTRRWGFNYIQSSCVLTKIQIWPLLLGLLTLRAALLPANSSVSPDSPPPALPPATPVPPTLRTVWRAESRRSRISTSALPPRLPPVSDTGLLAVAWSALTHECVVKPREKSRGSWCAAAAAAPWRGAEMGAVAEAAAEAQAADEEADAVAGPLPGRLGKERQRFRGSWCPSPPTKPLVEITCRSGGAVLRPPLAELAVSLPVASQPAGGTPPRPPRPLPPLHFSPCTGPFSLSTHVPRR
jgi:hypothetical protein